MLGCSAAARSVPSPELMARLGVDRRDRRPVGLHVEHALVEKHVVDALAAVVHLHLGEPGAGQTVPRGDGLGDDGVGRRREQGPPGINVAARATT